MPSDRTTVTELGTGLGMLGLPSVDVAVGSRTPVMRSLSPEMWERLGLLRAGGVYDAEFHAAWANGQAFLAAMDGLRGRLPRVVEWKGTGRAPGDEVAPIDLRVDHVYLVSCKYLSKILFNVSPAHVFDSLLGGSHARAGRAGREPAAGGGDWYAEVAPVEYQALYDAVRGEALRTATPQCDGTVVAGTAMHRIVREAATAQAGAGPVSLPGMAPTDAQGKAVMEGWSRTVARPRRPGVPPPALSQLPSRAADVTSSQREALGQWLRSGWPGDAKERYARLSDAVARASVRRWQEAIAAGGGSGESMLWRLLRIGSAPYFVLGSSEARSLRLRIATSWDWRRQYRLLSLAVEPQRGGQPRVGWEATIRDRANHEVHTVSGHMEVRWSHGRFGGLPEAKGYLDTPHHLVPGYVPLR